MSVSKAFAEHACYVNGALIHVRSASFSPGLRTAVEVADGEVYATYSSLTAGAPSFRVTTADVDAALDAIAVAGTAVSSNTAMWSRAYSGGGSRVAGATASHHKILVNAGLCVLRRLSARHGDHATVDFEVIANKSGSTAPVTYSEGVALPGSTLGADELWTLGSVSLNGAIEGVESVEVDFGVDVLSEAKDSDIYPTFLSVRRVMPSLRIRSTNIDLTSSLTEDGLSYSASQVVVTLAKRAEGGTFAGSGDKTLTMGKCRVDVVSISDDPRRIELLITPIATAGGSVDPITVA